MNETETSLNAERLECGDFSGAFGRGAMEFVARPYGLRRQSDSDDGAFGGRKVIRRLLSCRRQSGVALHLPPRSKRFATPMAVSNSHRVS